MHISSYSLLLLTLAVAWDVKYFEDRKAIIRIFPLPVSRSLYAVLIIHFLTSVMVSTSSQHSGYF